MNETLLPKYPEFSGWWFFNVWYDTNADAVNENADGELDDDSDGEVRTDDEDKKVVNNLSFCETDFFFQTKWYSLWNWYVIIRM